MTASEFARKALGLPAAGQPWPQPAGCMFCGRNIATGENASPFLPSKNFMDAAALTHRSQPGTLCGDCAALGTKTVMMATQNCLITCQGAFSLASSSAKKHFLLHPPPPPLVLCFSDTTLQHLIWRTPLSFSHALVYLRIAGRLFSMDLGRVLRAFELCRTLQARAGFAETDSPLLSLDYDWRSLTVAYLHPAIEAAASPAELAELCRLRPGEWWGIGILLLKAVPQPPTRIVLPAR